MVCKIFYKLDMSSVNFYIIAKKYRKGVTFFLILRLLNSAR